MFISMYLLADYTHTNINTDMGENRIYFNIKS